MERHATTAARLAAFLETAPGVARVLYPMLPSHPDHAVAVRLLPSGGGMLAVELAGGAPRRGGVRGSAAHPGADGLAGQHPHDRRPPAVDDPSAARSGGARGSGHCPRPPACLGRPRGRRRPPGRLRPGASRRSACRASLLPRRASLRPSDDGPSRRGPRRGPGPLRPRPAQRAGPPGPGDLRPSHLCPLRGGPDHRACPGRRGGDRSSPSSPARPFGRRPTTPSRWRSSEPASSPPWARG